MLEQSYPFLLRTTTRALRLCHVLLDVRPRALSKSLRESSRKAILLSLALEPSEGPAGRIAFGRLQAN